MKPETNAIADTKSTRQEVSDPGQRRRHFLVAAAATTGLVGVGVAVSVNVGRIEPGEQITVIWRGKPVWVLRRTPAMLEHMAHEQWIDELRDPDSSVRTQQPPYAKNPLRSIRPEIFVSVALCTHLGCVPLYRPDAASEGLGQVWIGGYYCPCHGSRFDLAGRVTKNVPAPTNLVVPPHRFINDDILEIGVDYATT